MDGACYPNLAVLENNVALHTLSQISSILASKTQAGSYAKIKASKPVFTNRGYIDFLKLLFAHMLHKQLQFSLFISASTSDHKISFTYCKIIKSPHEWAVCEKKTKTFKIIRRISAKCLYCCSVVSRYLHWEQHINLLTFLVYKHSYFCLQWRFKPHQVCPAAFLLTVLICFNCL